MTAERRQNLEESCKRYMESPYRRDKEYGEYLDRFLHGTNRIVDGMQYEDRQDKNPMPYNIYFGG